MSRLRKAAANRLRSAGPAVGRLSACALLCANLAHAPGARAQSLEPRAYANLPVGINFLLAGYTYSKGTVLPDPSLPAEDVAAELHGFIAAYARSVDLWGKSGLFSVIAPYVRGSVEGTLSGEQVSTERSGLADPAFKLSVNLLGAPALSLADFAGYRQDTIVGASLLVTAPWGQYDPNRIVNIGTNRWSFKPEVGASQALGAWVLEAAFAATLYTDNDAYQGDKRREQAPIYSTQFHVIYNFRPETWLALDATYYAGGRTKVDGVARDDQQSNWRWGATLALPVNKYNSVKLYASTGAYTRTGTDFDTVGIAWQVRWGGG